MEISLKGKNAMVCGGSAGIGEASAITLSKLGANVTIVARNKTKIDAVISTLDTSLNQKHMGLVADFSKPIEVELLMLSHVKTCTYHILINNTGGPPAGPIVNARPEDFINAYNMHLLCNHVISNALIPGMKAYGYGRIVNIISTSVKSPLPGLGVSNTTRGAVASWAKTLAGEVAPYGITVNNVLPGFTSTGRLDEIIDNKVAKTQLEKTSVVADMEATVPMRRFAHPSEVAAAVVFLASPAASYITGISLPVDGGRTQCL